MQRTYGPPAHSDGSGRGGATAARRTRASTITAPCGTRDDGVGVELGDLRVRLHERAETQQHVFDGCDVARRRAAVAVEQREGAQRAQHLPRVEVGERRDAHRHVAEHLGARSARAAGDHRAEALVVDHAHQQLHAGAAHRLHQQSVEPVAGAGDRRGDLRAPRPRTASGPSQAEAHAARVALVHQPRGDRLQRDRTSERRRRGHGLRRLRVPRACRSAAARSSRAAPTPPSGPSQPPPAASASVMIAAASIRAAARRARRHARPAGRASGRRRRRGPARGRRPRGTRSWAPAPRPPAAGGAPSLFMNTAASVTPSAPRGGRADRAGDVSCARHERRHEDRDDRVARSLLDERLDRVPVALRRGRGDHVDRVAERRLGREELRQAAREAPARAPRPPGRRPGTRPRTGCRDRPRW